MSKAIDTARKPLFAIMTIYALALFGSVWFLKHHTSSSVVLKIVVALCPMIPALCTIPLVIQRFKSMDEMQARHRLESGAVATMICAFLALTYGFLERAGFPRMSMFVVWVALGVSAMIANWVQRWRFR